jgi:hypothetical protein
VSISRAGKSGTGDHSAKVKGCSSYSRRIATSTSSVCLNDAVATIRINETRSPKKTLRLRPKGWEEVVGRIRGLMQVDPSHVQGFVSSSLKCLPIWPRTRIPPTNFGAAILAGCRRSGLPGKLDVRSLAKHTKGYPQLLMRKRGAAIGRTDKRCRSETWNYFRARCLCLAFGLIGCAITSLSVPFHDMQAKLLGEELASR